MFAAVYRWKVIKGKEERFREGWRRVTDAVYRRQGSLGSRLHKNEDGTWVAYAQWPDKVHWERAWKRGPIPDEIGYAMMRECLDPEVELVSPILSLTVTDDLFKPELFGMGTETSQHVPFWSDSPV